MQCWQRSHKSRNRIVAHSTMMQLFHHASSSSSWLCWFHTYIWTKRSLANAVTILRTAIVLFVGASVAMSLEDDSDDSQDTTGSSMIFLRTIPFLTISALLDMMDGVLARKFGSWECGRALDLMADILLWTVLYGTSALCATNHNIEGMMIHSSNWRVFVTLILSLEWATTVSMLLCTPSTDDQKQQERRLAGGQLSFRESFLRLYFRSNLRNPLASWAIVSHFIFPILYIVSVSTDLVEKQYWLNTKLQTGARILSFLGLLVYLYATLAMLLATTTATSLSSRDKSQQQQQQQPRYPLLSSASPLFWIALFHFMTTPLAVLVLIVSSNDTPSTSKVSTICSFLLVRVISFGLFYQCNSSKNEPTSIHASDKETYTTNPLPHLLSRQRLVVLLGDLWCAFMPLIAYAEVGSMLPLLHSDTFLRDMRIDHAILAMEEFWFDGQQPSVDWQPAHPFWKEFWHVVYVSHTPAIALSGVYYLSRHFRSPTLHSRRNKERIVVSNQDHASSILLSNMLCTNFACHVVYLILPTYGPLFTLASTRSVVEPSTESTTTATIANGVVALGQRFASTGTACPSSHCATAACIGITMVCCTTTHPRILQWFPAVSVIWSIAICISTVLCGMHYVVDVVAGILVGTMCCVPTIHGSICSETNIHDSPPANDVSRNKEKDC